MFDEVVVGVAVNATKTPLLTLDERVGACAEAVRDLAGVRAAVVPGLLVDFCRDVGARTIVKGIRGGADFDGELPMALMNRHLAGIDTIFLPGDPAFAHIASSMVRDVARHGGPIDDLVPPGLAALVHERIRQAGARTDPSHREGDRDA